MDHTGPCPLRVPTCRVSRCGSRCVATFAPTLQFGPDSGKESKSHPVCLLLLAGLLRPCASRVVRACCASPCSHADLWVHLKFTWTYAGTVLLHPGVLPRTTRAIHPQHASGVVDGEHLRGFQYSSVNLKRPVKSDCDRAEIQP